MLNNFKKIAINEGISEKTINETLNDIRFLPKVIEYDRYQPEFYEDTLLILIKELAQIKLKKV